MEIRKITAENAADLLLPNEPFSQSGQFVPSLKDGVWDYEVRLYETPKSMVFPPENYDQETIQKEGFALAAYEGSTCVGLAIFKDAFFRYMHLYDLKVSAVCRNKGVGKALIDAGLTEAVLRNYRGIYLQAQDDNLGACLFYLKCGFRIGGFDNRVYAGTSQAHKADILFYLDKEETL